VSVLTGTTVTRPLRVLIGADTYPPDINSTARFTARLAAGVAGAQRMLRSDVVHVQSHFQVGRDLLTAAFGVGYPTVATNHFIPRTVLQHPQVPDVATAPRPPRPGNGSGT
jgi:hypothetical protein